MVEKHGVDNPFKLREFQDKAVGTRTERYGAAYTLQDGSSLAAGARETFREHLRDEGFRKDLDARKKATCMERYGVEHPMQDAGVKAKVAKTLMENHGVDAPYKVAAWRDGVDAYHVDEGGANAANDKHRLTAEGRHDVSNADAARVAETRARYFAEHRGHHYNNRTTSDFVREAKMVHGDKYVYDKAVFTGVKDKVIITCPVHGDFEQTPLRHLAGGGCSRCAGNVRKTTAEFIESAREVHGDRYDYSEAVYTRAFGKVRIICPEHGVFEQTAHDHLGGSGCPKCWRVKSWKTSLEKYGTEHPMQSEQVQAKSRKTNLERLGVMYPGQSDECRRKMTQTNLDRYGVANIMSDPVAHGEAMRKRKRNGTLNASRPEEMLHDMLCDRFGIDDVERQYDDDPRYPFMCDFYIKSRDLFIELNGMWTHGPHWHGSDAMFDAGLLAYWEEHGGRMLDAAVRTWCESDVAKREVARKAALNYVVFWDGSDNIADARLWFAMGCPDGRDWEREYSWLPERELSFDEDAPKFGNQARFAVKVARWANGAAFYNREIAMWRENAFQSNWGTLQAQLYANRFKYLKSGAGGVGLYTGKLPSELTDWEIVRGLGIMGKLRAHTVFDNTAMRDVIARYGVEGVLDPCAGWGERMATCIQMGVDYFGIDVNGKLADGYSRIVSEYGDEKRHWFCVADSATADVDGMFDAVMTCPPYGDLEAYTDAGAENLDADGFARWWDAVVSNMSPHVARLFCVQTNQASKQVFADGLERHGWKLLESVELPRKSGHMTRGRGGVDKKREFEEVLVFGR